MQDTRPDVAAARAEYELAESLVASLDLSMQTPPIVQGWHSYCKDFEHTVRPATFWSCSSFIPESLADADFARAHSSPRWRHGTAAGYMG